MEVTKVTVSKDLMIPSWAKYSSFPFYNNINNTFYCTLILPYPALCSLLWVAGQQASFFDLSIHLSDENEGNNAHDLRLSVYLYYYEGESFFCTGYPLYLFILMSKVRLPSSEIGSLKWSRRILKCQCQCHSFVIIFFFILGSFSD
jgi:hypothetical protein